jgi:hypothetical protein
MAALAPPGRAGAAAAAPRTARAAPRGAAPPQQQPRRMPPHMQPHRALALLALLAAAAALPAAAASASGRGPLYSQDPPSWAPSARARRGPLASGNYDGRHRALLERLTSLRLPLSEHVIAQGYKFEPVPRQWARLTQKLTTPGSKVKIVTFGGSVSVGYRLSKTSYPEQLVGWLTEAFPGVEFELVNLARRATAATFAALCLVQVRPRSLGDGGGRGRAGPWVGAAWAGQPRAARDGGDVRRALPRAGARTSVCAPDGAVGCDQAAARIRLIGRRDRACQRLCKGPRTARQHAEAPTRAPFRPPPPQRTCPLMPTWLLLSTPSMATAGSASASRRRRTRATRRSCGG